ncbi:universal stress protein [Deinococcus rubellus]|uniref:universal stress protein n=1 Tax=Deinococcus rubellus TaxID=1889240 RepID=UPI0031EAF5BB
MSVKESPETRGTEEVKFRRILVTTDGSIFGNAALPFALDLALTYGAELTVCHVIPDPMLQLLGTGPYSYNYAEEERACREGAKRVLTGALAQLRGLQPRPLLLDGRARDVADCIAEAVQTEHINALVMGTHRHGGLLNLLVGSVAQRVLQQVSVPTLLVRPESGLIAPCLSDQPPTVAASNGQSSES